MLLVLPLVASCLEPPVVSAELGLVVVLPVESFELGESVAGVESRELLPLVSVDTALVGVGVALVDEGESALLLSLVSKPTEMDAVVPPIVAETLTPVLSVDGVDVDADALPLLSPWPDDVDDPLAADPDPCPSFELSVAFSLLLLLLASVALSLLLLLVSVDLLPPFSLLLLLASVVFPLPLASVALSLLLLLASVALLLLLLPFAVAASPSLVASVVVLPLLDPVPVDVDVDTETSTSTPSTDTASAALSSVTAAVTLASAPNDSSARVSASAVAVAAALASAASAAHSAAASAQRAIMAPEPLAFVAPRVPRLVLGVHTPPSASRSPLAVRIAVVVGAPGRRSLRQSLRRSPSGGARS